MNMNKKIIILVIAVIAVVGIFSYLYFSKNSETPLADIIPEAVKDITEALGGEINTNNWQTYTNAKLGFSIKHPSNYEAKEEGGGVIFVPPELKNVSAEPKTLKELPLAVLFSLDKSYDDIKKEIRVPIEGMGYREEQEKVIAGVLGTELKQGPSPESEHKLHQLFNIIPYKNTVLIFLTYALSKEQLENTGVPLLDAFISTFKPE